MPSCNTELTKQSPRLLQFYIYWKIYIYIHIITKLKIGLSLEFSEYLRLRKRPKFRFGSGLGWFWPVRFGKNFPKFFSMQFHAHLQYTGIKRTDYAILCKKLFSQSQHNATIHISIITFNVVKLSACCGEGFYIHALIL